MNFKRNWSLIALLIPIFFLFLSLNSCGGGSSFAVPTPEIPELEAWLQSCPGEVAGAVEWWNSSEYQNWSFGWNDEIYPTLEWVVINRKTNCYWFCKLFQKKFT